LGQHRSGLPIEPRIEWQRPTDARRRHQACVDECTFLTRWDAAPFETDPTDCFVCGASYEIWQPGVGGIRFSPTDPVVVAFPDHVVDASWFERVVTRSWMPAVYQVWGRQVLHASASVRRPGGHVVAFTGPSRSGKSTVAYSLAQRAQWTQLADDTLAFSVRDGAIQLQPLTNEARLRPATAAYHRRAHSPVAPLPWPDTPLHLSRVYVLGGDGDARHAATVEPLTAAESYTLLLEQAHAFTLQIPAFNQRILRDYLALAASVPAFRLSYPRAFDRLDTVLDRVEQHASAAIAS
jgi:hypothetical protein